MWVALGCVIVSCVLSAFSAVVSASVAQRAETVADDLAAEIEVRDAEECVQDWKRVDGSEQAVSSSINGVISLLFAAFPNANPDIVARVQELAPPLIERSQSELVQPTCDLQAAKERLEEE